jgi:hypothetical protein
MHFSLPSCFLEDKSLEGRVLKERQATEEILTGKTSSTERKGGLLTGRLVAGG